MFRGENGISACFCFENNLRFISIITESHTCIKMTYVQTTKVGRLQMTIFSPSASPSAAWSRYRKATAQEKFITIGTGARPGLYLFVGQSICTAW